MKHVKQKKHVSWKYISPVNCGLEMLKCSINYTDENNGFRFVCYQRQTFYNVCLYINNCIFNLYYTFFVILSSAKHFQYRYYFVNIIWYLCMYSSHSCIISLQPSAFCPLVTYYVFKWINKLFLTVMKTTSIDRRGRLQPI